MNVKSIVALILAVVLAFAVFTFAAAHAECSDNAFDIISTLQVTGTSGSWDMDDYALYDTVYFSAKDKTIVAQDAYSKTAYCWVFEYKEIMYAVVNAIIERQESDCLFIWEDTGNSYANIDEDAMTYLTATIILAACSD